MAKKLPNPIDKHVGSRLRMRRKMLGMSQGKIGELLNIAFQQVQKYEQGTNRISASRLQHLSHILQVPVPFFFEGASDQPRGAGGPATPAYVSEFLSSTDGLALVKAFTKVKEAKLRRREGQLVEEIAGDEPISQA